MSCAAHYVEIIIVVLALTAFYLSSCTRRVNLTCKIENLYQMHYPSLLCTYNELSFSEMKKQCQNSITLWIDFELKQTSFELK